MKHILLKAYFFFLPFNFLNLGSPYLQVTFIIAIILVLKYVYRAGIMLYHVHPLRKIALPLLLFWVYLISITLLNYESGLITTPSEIRQLTLHIFSFVVILYYIQKHPETKMLMYQYLNKGVFFLLMIGLLGVGSEVIEGGRLKLFGMNPNFVATFVATFMTILFRDFLKSGSDKWVIGFKILLGFYYLARLGSFTGVAMFAVGVGVIFLFDQHVKSVVARIVLLIVFSFVSYRFITSSDVFSDRLEDTENIENFSGRKGMWELGMSIFEANKVFGAGPVLTEKTVVRLTENSISFHNIYIQNLVWTGLIGSFLFFLFLFFSFKKVLKTGLVNRNPLLIALPLMAVISGFTGQYSFFFFSCFLGINENISRKK